MQLYVRPCYLVSAEKAVTTAVPIENSADCQVRGVIRFLQAEKIFGYLTEEASSRVELFCCTTMHVHILPGRYKPSAWVPLGHLRASYIHSGPGTIGLFPVSKYEGKSFANDENLKNAG